MGGGPPAYGNEMADGLLVPFGMAADHRGGRLHRMCVGEKKDVRNGFLAMRNPTRLLWVARFGYPDDSSEKVDDHLVLFGTAAYPQADPHPQDGFQLQDDERVYPGSQVDRKT